MEEILAQMQSVILAEHHAKLRSLENECATLRQALCDKELAPVDSQSTKKRRLSADTNASEQSKFILGCGMVLCGHVRTVKVVDESGMELTMHIHDEVLRQVPYLTAASDFAEKAGKEGTEVRIELPSGCPFQCAALLFWRLYLGDGYPLGSCLPVSNLSEAVAVGKLADMLLLENLFKEIDAVARRFAFRSADALRDPSLPEFLQSLAAQTLRTPQLSESDISEMFKNAAMNAIPFGSRTKAEELLNSNPNCAAPVISALLAIVPQMLLTIGSSHWRDRMNEQASKKHLHEPLSWLLEVVQSHIDDPAAMVAFFEKVSIMQSKTSGIGWKDEQMFGAEAREILRSAFKKHLQKCNDRDSLVASFSIAVRSEVVHVTTPNPGQIINVFAAESCGHLLRGVFPHVLARGALLGCRASLMKQVFELRTSFLHQVCSPQFLALLTPQEELEMCKQIGAGQLGLAPCGYLQIWATVPIISALALDARQFVCAKLFTSLGYLTDEVRHLVVKEMQGVAGSAPRVC